MRQRPLMSTGGSYGNKSPYLPVRAICGVSPALAADCPALERASACLKLLLASDAGVPDDSCNHDRTILKEDMDSMRRERRPNTPGASFMDGGKVNFYTCANPHHWVVK